MDARIRRLQLLFFLLIPLLGKTQLPKLSPQKQQLLLQLSLNYWTVVKEGLVDQDSSLLLVSQKDHISRWTVITDNFGKELAQSDNKWIDTRQTAVAVKRLSALHGIDRIKLLVLLGAYYAFQPGNHQKDRDSSQYFLSYAKRQSEALHLTFWTNQILCLLGKNYFKGNQIKNGTDCFTTVITNCQKTRDKSMEAKAWDYQGTYIPPSSKTILLKISSIKKANELYQQVNQPAKQVNTLMNIAYLGFVLKDMNGAETSALKALQIQNDLNFQYVHYTYDILSLISAAKGTSNKDLNYSLKAVQVSLATRDSLGLAYFYARVGHVMYGQKATVYPFSNYWTEKAIAEFNRTRNPDVYLPLFNLTTNLYQMGKSAEAIILLQNTLKNVVPVTIRDKSRVYLSMATNYKSLKNYHEAEKYYLMADQMSRQDTLVTKDYRNSYIKYEIGLFYLTIKNYDKAESYLQEALKTPGPKNDELELFLEVNMALYKIDSVRGNYESAAGHLQQYIRFNEAQTESNDAKGIAGMKLQFLMTQKEKDLEILQAKSALQNQQAIAIRKFIFMGSSAALLIIGMLYSRYYINRKQRQAMDKKNLELQHVIGEKDELIIAKEWLLKEVHHRVKNNLHTVICLLESQAAYLENDALKAIENSKHRIYAMSLIHQKLYQSDDIKTVDMFAFLPEFIRYMNDSFETGSQIRFQLDIEPLKLGVSYAVPLSLIINEAVTNSIKYAFPDDREGVIAITLHKSGDQVALTIGDNGIGIDLDQLNTSSASLGMKLLIGLSADIKADIRIENKNGTIITLAFKIDEMMYATIS
jgi:two-component sensor histidine kinase